MSNICLAPGIAGNKGISRQQVIPTDTASIARGKHSVEAIWLCQECHGENLAGPNVEGCEILPSRGFEDNPLFVKLMPRNLTSGIGGIGNIFDDEDYVRAIRHGVGMDNESLIIMPPEHYNKISDKDLGEIIAYLKTIPPVDNELDESTLNPLGRIVALFEGSLLPESVIDDTAVRANSPEVGVTAEYGGYLAGICTLCHREGLSGGVVPGDEDGPKAPDLTTRGAPGNWMTSEFMPWYRFNQMTDDELNAIWLYLQSEPGK